MTAKSTATNRFRVIETEWIPLSDGTQLAARIWLPIGAAADPVPAILEYLPYRRRDGSRRRDDITFPYFAEHGYAGVRVDMRGSGDSDGLLTDEYTAQELADGVEVIDWLARQNWCSGAVGMIGISWGGFNGLQIAALAPAPLKAIITACSTDDRYGDDIHYKGGCLLNDNMTWSQQMLAYSTRPPDPEVVGERWREIWIERLNDMPLLAAIWLEHQHRDWYWKHGSVCEDYGAIKAAVLAVGGWADAYTDATFRLLEGLPGPCRALIGPWEHAYPNIAAIGPREDFLKRAVQWWDHWLKGIDSGVMAGPALTAFVHDSVAPSRKFGTAAGRWVDFTTWPAPNIQRRVFHLNAGGLDDEAKPGTALTVSSPQDTGSCAGNFCPGMRLDDELPGDQREDDAHSVVFDSAPLERPITVFGAPTVRLQFASDKRSGFIVARLCDLAPDGSSRLISWGVQNLSHRLSHENPSALAAGVVENVTIELNGAARDLPRGHRLRLALSNAYWPMIWPSPEPARLSVCSGTSLAEIPIIASAAAGGSIEVPEELLEPVRETRRTPQCRQSQRRSTDGSVVAESFDDFGAFYDPVTGLEAGSTVAQQFKIHPDDPLSAEATAEWTQTLARGRWSIRTETMTTMTADRTHFHLTARLAAYEGEEMILQREWLHTVPRDLV